MAEILPAQAHSNVTESVDPDLPLFTKPSTSLSRASATLTEPIGDGSPAVKKKRSIAKNYSMDPILYMYTSLTAGSSHIVTATQRMETILRANRIPFRALDLATDEKAKMLWGRRAGKDAKGRARKIPALVQQGLVVGDITEVEEWNEYGELRQHVKVVTVPGQKVEIASKLNKDLNKENIKPAGDTALSKTKKNTLASSTTNARNKVPADTAYKPASSNTVLKEQIFEADSQTMAMRSLADQVAAKAKEKDRARIRENATNVRRSFLFTPSAKEGPLESLAAITISAQMQSPGSTSWNREPEGIMSIVGEISKAYSPGTTLPLPFGYDAVRSPLDSIARREMSLGVKDTTSMQSPVTGRWKGLNEDDVFAPNSISEQTKVFDESRPSTANLDDIIFENVSNEECTRRDTQASENQHVAQETRLKREKVMKEIETKGVEKTTASRRAMIQQNVMINTCCVEKLSTYVSEQQEAANVLTEPTVTSDQATMDRATKPSDEKGQPVMTAGLKVRDQLIIQTPAKSKGQVAAEEQVAKAEDEKFSKRYIAKDKSTTNIAMEFQSDATPDSAEERLAANTNSDWQDTVELRARNIEGTKFASEKAKKVRLDTELKRQGKNAARLVADKETTSNMVIGKASALEEEKRVVIIKAEKKIDDLVTTQQTERTKVKADLQRQGLEADKLERELKPEQEENSRDVSSVEVGKSRKTVETREEKPRAQTERLAKETAANDQKIAKDMKGTQDTKATESLTELEALEKQLAILEKMNAEIVQAAAKAKGTNNGDYDPFRPKSKA